MKQQVTLALSLTLAAGLLAGCADTTGGSQPTGAAQTSPADATPSAAQSAAFTDEMKIPHAVDLSPEDGADSVERLGDHADSPYFAHPDYYHMQSSDTLTILTGFQTMQQTSEWACGVTSTLMVLNWYDRLGDWNEESLAALRHSLEGTGLAGYPGTTLRQAMDIFDGVGGFTYTTTLEQPDIWMEDIQAWLAGRGQAGHGLLERLGRTLAGDHRLRHHGHRDPAGRRVHRGRPLRHHRPLSGRLRRADGGALPV